MIVRFGIVVLIATILLNAGILRAAVPETMPVHSFEVGPEVYYYEYEEPGLMKNEGVFYGPTAAYTYRKNRQMAKIDARFAFGKVDYTSQDTGSQDDIDDYVLEVRGVVGYDLVSPHYSSAMTNVSFVPYLGFAYRYLNDDSGGTTTSTGNPGYERESNYYYSPIGIEVTKYFEQDTASGTNSWSIGLILEYDYFWRGEQVSCFSDVDPLYDDIHSDQKEGYGLRGSIKIASKTPGMDLIFEPYVRYWDIDDSEIDDVIYGGVVVDRGREPHNHTTEIGLKVALGF